ncbi:MAG: winged helix-turn-helix transcriptional regulator [Dehalococcoidia bacterium]|nr:winged helix-turn-helix transcriptional regulator [Dehalococcoidia bacterium]
MRNLVRVLKSLSDETRLRMLNMLFERECCVCEIMQVLDISQPRASHHLIALYNAGLLKMRRQGLFALYSIDWSNMDAYVEALIKAVRKGMEGNEQAAADLRKLATAQRLLPDCAAKV